MKYLKNCEVAVDPFHVIKHLTDGFTRIRVDIMNQCVYNSPSYYLLKKWHRLLETDKYDLDNKPRSLPMNSRKCTENSTEHLPLMRPLKDFINSSKSLKQPFSIVTKNMFPYRSTGGRRSSTASDALMIPKGSPTLWQRTLMKS